MPKEGAPSVEDPEVLKQEYFDLLRNMEPESVGMPEEASELNRLVEERKRELLASGVSESEMKGALKKEREKIYSDWNRRAYDLKIKLGVQDAAEIESKVFLELKPEIDEKRARERGKGRRR